ncbi:FliH/SctL family protein [Lentisalinibacter sediminis]|uniref:FliH/SctL family protein n=1 Tax=Lentisalinibacter sediminis TaxID=2992237 RepID=UPI00386AFE1B
MSESATDKAATRWQQPDIGDEGLVTASRLETLQREAYEEAWRQGYEEGLQAGADDVGERAARLQSLLGALCKPFEELDDEVEEQVLRLVTLAVRQLLRRELQSDPGHVIGVVRDALRMLPVASRSIEVQLHPEDAALVREALTVAEEERPWRLTEDPLVTRGGCLVKAEKSRIDATVESRLNRTLAGLIEDERT